jgi:hypothetical protein
VSLLDLFEGRRQLIVIGPLGFEVILTPRAADKGRDVIATRRGVGSIRFFDQVRRMAGHLVPAN